MYGFGLTGGHWGGALSDELTVPFADGMLVRSRTAWSPRRRRAWPTTCATATATSPRTSPSCGRSSDPSVLIVGAMAQRHLYTASVSLYTGLTAKALGIEEVVLADVRPEVRDQAAALGLKAVAPDDLGPGRLFPLVADVGGTPRGLAYALSHTAPDGRCSSSGTLHATARIPATLMYGRNATLTIARTHARAVIPEVLALITSGRLQPERVTTTVASIDDAPAALAEHVRAGSTKTILTA